MNAASQSTSAIQLLPPSVAARIAAGEVIDRPAAAVKELIENALDAGATGIQVEALGGGLRLIRVSDNGCGIPADQVELAVRPHATSKLRTLDDLEQLQTFGFRGEALASIAAVAELELSSAVEGEAGFRCAFHLGRLQERSAAGRVHGTTVTVRDLFSQMPARLKFLRGARAEAVQIGAAVRRFALARPDVRLTLLIEGHRAFESSGRGAEEAQTAVYGATTAAALRGLAPVDAAGAKISGALTEPSMVHATRSQLSLFVNGRYVRSPALLNAIEAGYRTALPRGRHPAGVIFLSVEPDGLDVNVHPAKLDVRLAQEGEITRALTAAVASLYGRHPRALRTTIGLTLDGAQQRMPGLRRIAESGAAWSGWGSGVDLPAGATLPALRLLGQAANALLVAEAGAGLYLIDQHRAHERVIYERILSATASAQQALIEPAIIALRGAAAERLAERAPALEELGFVCEPFGGDSFIVRAVPGGDGQDLHGGALRELLAEAASDQSAWRERLLTAFSCRSAIRKGRQLGAAEACDLVTRLGRVASPALCPHGSPVVIQIGDAFLSRQFNWG